MSSCYFLSFTMKTAGFSRNFATSNIKKTKLGLKFPTCTQSRTRIPILKCFHWSRDGLVSAHFIERTLKSPFATYNLLIYFKVTRPRPVYSTIIRAWNFFSMPNSQIISELKKWNHQISEKSWFICGKSAINIFLSRAFRALN